MESVLDALPELRDTWIVRTGRQEPGPGFHVFVRSAGKVPTIQGAAFHDELGIDVKAEGSYVIAAPSLHASGAFYETERGEPETIVRG